MSVSTPVTGRKVRFALVGCGRISKNHLGAIVAHANDAELVDVCDIDPVSLQAAVSETGATGHTSLDAMLATTTADAVIVTTPSGLHPNQTIAHARSGRHGVSEKPMATRWPAGLRRVRACQEAGVPRVVVQPNHPHPTVQVP